MKEHNKILVHGFIATGIMIIVTICLLSSVSALYYPPENYTNSTPIKIIGNGRMIVLQAEDEYSKPILSFNDATGRQVGWIVCHDKQPEFEGDNVHRHCSWEVSKANGDLYSRIIIPYDQDIADIKFVASNIMLMSGEYVYFDSGKGSYIVYKSWLKEKPFIINSPNILELKATKTLRVSTKRYTPKSNDTCLSGEQTWSDSYAYYCNSQGKWGRTKIEYGW